MRHGVVIGAIVLAVAAGAGAAWYFAGEPWPFGSKQEASKPQPLAIHAASVRQAEILDDTAYTASVVSPQIAELHPRVSGTVMRRPFQPGGQVKRGDLLFMIDPRPFEANLAEHTAQRAQAAAALAYAQDEVDRYRPLEQRGFASQERLQQAQRNHDTAAGQVNEADARILRDHLDIEYSRVVAPFDGQAGITNVNVGDLAVSDQTDLVSLAQLDPIDVQVAISAADMGRVREAMAAGHEPNVALLGPDGKPDGRQARFVEFDNQYNPRTTRMLVRARLPNPELSLAPGQFLHVQVRFGTSKQLLVPTDALTYRLNQQLVYVVTDGKVHSQVVSGTRQHGDDTVITAGLHEGDRVATDHLDRLHAGQAVSVEEDNAPAAAEQASAGN